MNAWGDPNYVRLTNVQAAAIINAFAADGMRVLPEVLSATVGFQFQFANGFRIAWHGDELTFWAAEEISELRR